jgi:bifunctional non-homologous end joining protein LigD
MAATKRRVQVQNRSLELSNLDKVLYPDAGFTKAGVLNYYRSVAPWLLPHVRVRALTLKRYPEGVAADSFYEKRCPGYRPDWLPTQEIHHRDGNTVRYCVVTDLASLMWIANTASLELHVLLSRIDPERPTMVVFDLDPGPPAGLIEAGRVALLLRRVLERIGLELLVKVSGKKGLHCYVPLNTPANFDQTKAFAHTIANRVASHYPDLVTSVMSKAERVDKVFVDWSQNDRNKTTVCAYSLRAVPEPMVSAPITWDELAVAVKANRPEKLQFTTDVMPKRLEKLGDIFEPLLSLRQKLPGAGALESAPVATWESNVAAGARTNGRSERGAPRKTRRTATDGAADGAAALARYRRMRDFTASPEPSGAVSPVTKTKAKSGSKSSANSSRDLRGIFVVQKHAARNLHYDFRIECQGVLKSWAVPKGPSLDPQEKRLAVQVEDHPLDYARFEGRIPAGQYGAGQVIVWDFGPCTVPGEERDRDATIAAALEKGHLTFVLAGVKLHGAFDLVRTRPTPDGKQQWLLIKRKDESALPQSDPLTAEPYSVLSGLWVEDIAEADPDRPRRTRARSR